VSLATELLKKFEPKIESLALVPSDGGRFEIQVNNTLVYSKLQTGRHANPGEVADLVEKITKKE
jgi:selenoprotein W-related protein